MTCKIITDSASDLPKQLQQDYDIDVVPLFAYIDETEYLDDGKDLEPKELYHHMRNGSMTKTAQATYKQLKTTFEKYVDKDVPVIYLAFSSELSGTYQTAKLVKNDLLEDYPDFDLNIIDTKCASLGQGMVVYRTALLAHKGKSKETLLEAAEFYKDHTEHIFTVDDLTYISRGGRVSKTSAFVGGVLSIKPILHVDDGKLIPVQKVRGKKRVAKAMLDLMEKRGINLNDQIIGINHADDEEGALLLRDKIKAKFNCNEFVIDMIGCAVGAHAGPGTLSVYFLNDLSPEF